MHHKIHTEDLTLSEKRQLWANILIDQRNSGMNQSQYCRTHGLKHENFSYYLQQSRRAQKVQPPKFLPMAINEHSISTEMTLMLPGSLSLKLPLDYPVNSLIEMLKQLGAIPC